MNLGDWSRLFHPSPQSGAAHYGCLGAFPFLFTLSGPSPVSATSVTLEKERWACW